MTGIMNEGSAADSVPRYAGGDDADLCTEALRVRRYFQQRGGSSGEKAPGGSLLESLRTLSSEA